MNLSNRCRISETNHFSFVLKANNNINIAHYDDLPLAY